MEDLAISTQVGIYGFVIGLIFGGVANKTNFCTMGAISDMVLMGDKNRFRAWMMALAVGVIATQTMVEMGLFDINRAIYRTSNLYWLGAIIGGVMFGFGMTRASGCGNKTLVRIGGGNLKSLVVFLVLGTFAYMTLRGIIGLARVNWIEVTNWNMADSVGLTNSGLDTILAAVTGLDAAIARWIMVAVIAGGLLVYCFKDAEFRGSVRDMAAGLIIGLLIAGGWYATGVAAYDEFEPIALESFTFVAPIGNTEMYLMTFTGSTINFGIAAVLGVIAGSFLVSIATRSFHWESFNGLEDTASHLYGGALMGVGGVLALGCTVGQGLTGMSTMALGSLIATLSIIFGGIWGMKAFEEGSLIGGLKGVFTRD